MITGWEPPDVLTASLDTLVGRYVARLGAEDVTVTDGDGGVTVVMAVSGTLSSVDIDARLRRRCSTARLAEVVLAAIGRAERAAQERRAELGAELRGDLGAELVLPDRTGT